MFWCGQFPISFPANSPSKRVWIEDWNLSIGLDLLYYRYYIYIYGWWFQIYFSIIYGIILPIDELIFFRGVGISPTIYIYIIYIHIIYIYINWDVHRLGELHVELTTAPLILGVISIVTQWRLAVLDVPNKRNLWIPLTHAILLRSAFNMVGSTQLQISRSGRWACLGALVAAATVIGYVQSNCGITPWVFCPQIKTPLLTDLLYVICQLSYHKPLNPMKSPCLLVKSSSK